jgi:hypothetical protein
MMMTITSILINFISRWNYVYIIREIVKQRCFILIKKICLYSDRVASFMLCIALHLLCIFPAPLFLKMTQLYALVSFICDKKMAIVLVDDLYPNSQGPGNLTSRL